MTPSQFQDLVSGRRRGPWAATLRGLCRAAEVPYTWAVRRRNRRYDSGAAVVHRLDVPLVSVGNLTLGGTGKTPMVQWLARWFLQRQFAVGIVSRGYGARAGEANDEALELARNLPGVPHVQDPDRVAGARRAIDEFHCRLVLLDDAFQHRRIARDLDIVLLDALEPLGFGHVFPRGTLREPPEGLVRAHVIGLSRADSLPPAQRQALRGRIEHYAPRALWIELAHRPRALVNFSRIEQPPGSLSGRPVLAFCGIGNPAGFRHTLACCGFKVARMREFPDHHHYTVGDLAALAADAQRLDVTAVLCTQKDLVKLGTDRLGDFPLWAVAIDMDLLAGREELQAMLNTMAER